ncbi:MAG: ADP-ribose pyrophosphatase [Sphingomonadales bacterium]|nr:ADP-ribose pyrophosphatase [Sphingomonadales bacterium]
MAELVWREPVYDGWYRFARVGLRLPDGAVVERHLLDNGSAVMVLPYDPVRRVVMLITQPRAGVLASGAPPVLEALAGGLDGMAPEQRIREEAMEEGGLRLGTLEWVARVWSLPPVSTEQADLYLAAYGEVDRIGPGGGAADEQEHITVQEVGFDALRAMVLAGELADAKTLVLAQALLLRHPELWD